MSEGLLSRRSLLHAGAGLPLLAALGAGPARAAPAADGITAGSPMGRASGRLARPAKPLVLAHRGASALRPEHTLAAYAKAIADGADFIEPDLVATRDGFLVARHENNIAETTDVAQRPGFANRRKIKLVDGVRQQGWFTEDFTLAELQLLRTRERLPGMRGESHGYDGEFRICSFAEIVDFVAAEAAARGRTIGIVPEIKHSTYFARRNLAIEPRLKGAIATLRYLRQAPLIIQSFETANLRQLRKDLAGHANVRLMQLVGAPADAPWDWKAAGQRRTYADMIRPAGLAEVAAYADYLAPELRALMPLGADQRLAAPTGLVEAAHGAGLLVAPYAFRPENAFLAADFRDGHGAAQRNEAGSLAEIRRYLALGIDGFFTDDPALGRLARDRG